MGEAPTQPFPVLYLNHSMEMGGIETLIDEFATRFRARGLSPSVGVLNGGGTLEGKLHAKGIPVIRLGKRDRVDLDTIAKLRQILKRDNVKVLHTHNYSSWFYGVLAVRGIGGVRHIHTEHSNVECRRWIYAERLMSRFTNKIVSVSGSVKDFMVERQHISPGRIEVIYNGVDTQRFRPDSRARTEYRNKFSFGEKTFVACIVARLSPVKDHETLLGAFSMLAKERPETRLLIVGEGDIRVRLESLSRDLGVCDRVIFLGERHDIPEILNAADVFVLSSISEGHNMSLLEAMATGIPVVVTRVGGNTEIVLDGVCGFLVPPRDPHALCDRIGALAGNESLMRAMGEKGREAVLKCFNVDGMIDRYLRLYLG